MIQYTHKTICQYNIPLALSMFISVSTLKCYVGTGSSKKSQECISGMTKCMNTITSGVTNYMCTTSIALTSAGLREDGCKTVSNVKFCVCSTNNCNMEAGGNHAINIKCTNI